MLTLVRKLKPGDKIICQGVKVVIKEIHYADYCRNGDFYNEVIIEFTDTEGNYRSWKSDVDGGSVELKDISKSAISSNFDMYTGRYGVSFDEIDEPKTLAILSLIENGYSMTAYQDEDDNCHYTIFNLKDDSRNYQNIDNCRGLLEKLFIKIGVKPFIKVPLDTYFSSAKCQKAIDTILLESADFNNQVNGYSVCLIVENGYLKLIEVLDACI